jgi:hypothetical protein
VSSTKQKRGSLAALIAAIVLSGLAAGALWCLLSIFIDTQSAFVLIAFAAIIGWFMRWLDYADRRGATGAVIATLIAFVYAQYLFAAVRMANLLGFPLRDTLFRMDLPYAWRLVQGSVSAWDFAFLVFALIAGASVAFWKR